MAPKFFSAGNEKFLSFDPHSSLAMKRYWCLLLGLAGAQMLAGAGPARLYKMEPVAGSSRNGDGGAAVAAQIGPIRGTAADRWGNLYLSDTDHHRVRKIDSSGAIRTVAGTGAAGFSGDGQQATAAALNLPFGLAVDGAGNLYIADLGNDRVRRVGVDGAISTFAGGGTGGDGGAAASARLRAPRNLAVDFSGNVYISEFDAHAVRRVSAGGIISTVAGKGISGFGGDGGLAIWGQLSSPAGLAVDPSGNLYIADSGNNRVRKVDTAGFIRTVLGGTEATAIEGPVGLAMNAAGTLYVADNTFAVRAYSAGGAWTNFAGSALPGFSGDGGLAVLAHLTRPGDVAVDPAGTVLIADGNRLRAVDSRGYIRTAAGAGYLTGVGDGGAADSAILAQPAAVALDLAGNLYIADTGTGRIRRVSASGVIATVAGTGEAVAGRDGVATDSALHSPTGVAVDSSGNILIADTGNHRIRQVGADGRVATIAGSGAAGFGAENQPPIDTRLNAPRGVCSNRAGTVFVVDTGNHRVLRFTRNTAMQTAAGTGAAGYSGDNAQPRFAQLNQPSACAVDSFGNLFIADTGNHAVRRVSAAGILTSVAGDGVAGFTGDEAPAAEARLAFPAGLAVDDSGNVYIADTGNHRIRQITPDGVIHSIAGDGTARWSGDGDAALSASLNQPGGLFLDGAGDLYFADTGNQRVRRLAPETESGPEPAIAPPAVSVVNAASQAEGPVAAGELITILGAASGAEVRFDGASVPILYSQEGAVTVQVPAAVAGLSKTHLELQSQGEAAVGLDLVAAEAAPGLFPVALNPDISLNSKLSPAPRGALVVLYGTGAGSGKTAPSLTIGGTAAELLSASEAGNLPGTLQILVRVPSGLPAAGAVAVELKVGAAVSPPLTIWVK
jgi:trimeric autotransporter adhesin